MTETIDYTSRDFSSIRADLVARTQRALPEWSGNSAADMLMVILEQFAYVGDIQNFYIDRAAAEAFLVTAALRTSVLNIAEMLDYTPITQQAATTTLQFTAAAGSGVTTIVGGTIVATAPLNGNSPIYFETDHDLVIDTGDTAVGSVAATEGTTIYRETVASSNGGANQVYSLLRPRTVQGSWHVFVADGPPDVNGAATFTEWTYVRRMVDAAADTAAFTTITSERGTTYVVFGDGAAGRVPPVGATVEVTYRIGTGDSGNIGMGLVRDLVTPIVNIVAVTNITPASGGSDPETIQALRASIPRSVRAVERAVTLDDFSSLAQQVPGVAKANAVGASSSSVTIYIKAVGAAAVTPQLITAVKDYFASRVLVGTTVTVLEATSVAVNVTATVQADSRHLQSTVDTAVQDAVEQVFAFDNQDIAGRVKLAEVFRAMVDTPGVEFVDITVLSRTVSGLSDVVLAANEIAIAGTINITTTGGIV